MLTLAGPAYSDLLMLAGGESAAVDDGEPAGTAGLSLDETQAARFIERVNQLTQGRVRWGAQSGYGNCWETTSKNLE